MDCSRVRVRETWHLVENDSKKKALCTAHKPGKGTLSAKRVGDFQCSLVDGENWSFDRKSMTPVTASVCNLNYGTTAVRSVSRVKLGTLVLVRPYRTTLTRLVCFL